ncbi:glycosyltransferase family 2 protein [Herbaspirillum rubrisubalbicans]|uniref:Glycosyltransferase family 2 protein n=1 Tax=Herbaspirillum rubrisubalbicans TaxID=80842 RepID=A0AAD0U6Q3_9BURK|nr:glycosyltransferase family A protein [Herbaspirillum rubrisubalbicans]AYR24105.1 glycosyltransferase family 2 protein [Herbaspirillum rubrisubalbicans]
MEYLALIRTFNSLPLAQEVIQSLRSQSCPPTAIMAVDSGSDADQAAALRGMVDVWLDVSGQPFNYSRSINLGVQAATLPNVLIISSHVVLRQTDVMERFFQELASKGDQVGSLISNKSQAWLVRQVGPASFTGVNGLTNSCSFAPTALLRELPFREEVFASEDQEWTKRFLAVKAGGLTIVETALIDYLNKNFSYKKKYNEEMALATFVDARRMGLASILTWLLKSVWSIGVKGDIAKASHRFKVALGLFKARFKKPDIHSKYY